jgi:hypothetical protein
LTIRAGLLDVKANRADTDVLPPKQKNTIERFEGSISSLRNGAF